MLNNLFTYFFIILHIFSFYYIVTKLKNTNKRHKRMKSIAIILIILFLIVSSFLGFLIIKKVLYETEKLATAPEIEEPPTIKEERAITEKESEKAKNETVAAVEEIPDIEKVEIYLDGDKENGIFLGEADYGLHSEEAVSIYGGNLSDSGYRLLLENNQYDFKPGSIHTLYVYTFIPEHGWDYISEEIKIPGELDTAQNIKLYVDNPKQNSILKDKVNISGWAANINPPDNPYIDKVEIYLDGPKDFGKFLGEATYGLDRPDVAKALNNENYTKSGYVFTYDLSNFEPGSSHSFYVYAYSPNGEYQLVKRDIKIEGEKKESKSIIFIDTNLGESFKTGKIEIKGWAINRDKLKEGVALTSDDIEYKVKKIVFVSNKTGNEDIFSMNLDGTELTQLTDYPGNDMYPSVSPDGKKIAYTSDIGGSWEIIIMDWDGSNKTQITFNPERNGYPRWSFDGKYIFFEMHIEGNWELYRINSDGSNMKRLTFNPGADDWHPCGHPYEYKVIYESGTPGHEDIYIMDYNGENIKKISDFPMRKRVPYISKDGKTIVFGGYEKDNSDIFTMDINGENIKKLTVNPESDGHPSFSPDNLIAYEAKIDGSAEIFIMNMDGSNKTQLTNFPGDDWGPVFMYQK